MLNKDEPAFPFDYAQYHYRGLTKREFMATQILAGLMSTAPGNPLNAERAVSLADELLEKLKSK